MNTSTLPLAVSLLATLSLATANAQNLTVDSPVAPSISGTSASADGSLSLSSTIQPIAQDLTQSDPLSLVGNAGSFFPSPSAPGSELIVNGDFEDIRGTFVDDGQGGMTLPPGEISLTGWEVLDGQITWLDNSNASSLQTPYGSRFLNLSDPSGTIATLQQKVATIPGRQYQLSLNLASNATQPNAGGVKSVAMSAGSTALVATLLPQQAAGDEWQGFALLFTATDYSTPIRIRPLTSGFYLGIDQVSVIESAPNGGNPPDGNLVQNGSFEIDSSFSFAPDATGIMSIPDGSSLIPHWVTSGAELSWIMNGNATGLEAAHTQLFLDLTGASDAPPYASISQEIATEPGLSYILSFWLGSAPSLPTHRGPVGIQATAGSRTQSFTTAPPEDPPAPGTTWQQFYLRFTAQEFRTLISFTGSLATGGSLIGLDQIAVLRDDSPTEITLDIQPADPQSDSLQLSFTTQPNITYTLEETTSLGSLSWNTVPNATLVGNGSVQSLTVPNQPTEPARFFRVRTEP